MRVAFHVVEARRNALARQLRRHGYLTLARVCRRLGVSPATARRDLAALAREGIITRTYGGALGDYDRRFPSFRARQRKAQASKRRLAQAALRMLRPGMTVFFDAGTTIYSIGEALASHPVSRITAVTNALHLAEALGGSKVITVQLVGGEFLARQSILVGPQAQRSAALWRFDLALLSAEGMTPAGLWNSQADIVAFQRKVATRSRRVVCCLDATKLGRKTPAFLLPWSRVDGLLTEATARELREAGIILPGSKIFTANPLTRRKPSP